MKIKKSIIIKILQIISLFFILFFSVIVDEPLLFILGLLVLIIAPTAGSFIECRKITIKINECFSSCNYQEVIDFLNKKNNKNYFDYTNKFCLIYLVLFYMYNDEAIRAKELIVNYPILKNTKELFYTRYIIAIAENNKNESDIYFNKVMELKSKQFNVQKEAIVKIKKMLESNICDEHVLATTKIPLVKKICMKIKGEEVVIDPLNLIEIKNKEPIAKAKDLYKFLKIILNILTCLTLYIGLAIIVISIEKHNVITSFEGLYRGLQKIWVMFLLLPISIGNVAFGLFLKSKNYRYKSNFIIGIIFSILLFLYGSMSFLSIGQFKEDKEYLDSLENTIVVDFPDDFNIVISDWTRGEQSSSDNTLLKYETVVRFITNESLIFDEKWNDELVLKDKLPTLFVIQTTSYEKYLIFCYNTKEFNPQTINKDYDYVAIAYDKENNNLLIYEFYLK